MSIPRPGSPSLAERAYDDLKAQIIAHVHSPGTILSEQVLGQALGMSRTPVREALAQLEWDGLVRTLPGRGYLIEGLTAREVTEIYGFREAIEAFAISGLAGHVNVLYLRKLDALFSYYLSDGIPNLDPIICSILSEADGEFHESFSRFLGNELMVRECQRLALKLVLIRSISWSVRSRLVVACIQHRQIIACLLSDDLKGAEELLRKHLRESHQHMLVLLGSVDQVRVARPILPPTGVVRSWLMDPEVEPSEIPSLISSIHSAADFEIRSGSRSSGTT